MLPSRTLIGLLGAAGAVLIGLRFTSLAPAAIVTIAAALSVALLALLVLDVRLSWISWMRSPLTLTRRLPHAFAVGSAVGVQVSLTNPGPSLRRGRYFELADPTLSMPAMPLRFAIKPGERETFEFNLTPTARGLKCFEAGQLRLRSILGLLDCNLRIGPRESRRVFPDFKRQASLAWLATDRRLAELGIKNVRRRGEGTDFDQLTEYRAGDPVRNIDWKATLKHGRPIARVFQDERDQSVLFLLDCGRRMRADDTQSGIGASHFDQSLDALMLLTFVALASGDAVGAMTFGTAVGQEKRFAPRKGRQTLNELMAALGDVEPSPIFSDYLEAAADVMQPSAQARADRAHHQLPRGGLRRAAGRVASVAHEARRRGREPARANRRCDGRATVVAAGIDLRGGGGARLRAKAPRHVAAPGSGRRRAHRL